MNLIDKQLSSQVLKYLEDIGWSELIDDRWKNEVVEIIKTKFPEINEKTLEHILNIIIF